MKTWIWQQAQWPDFTWQVSSIDGALQRAESQLQSLLLQAGALQNEDMLLDTLLQNILSSSAIEQEVLNADSVRSSLAKRLGLEVNTPVTDRSEGVAQLMMDVVEDIESPLTLERIYQWHTCLFPTAEFGLSKLKVGELRGSEPMQVISGRLDRPTIHFEAPPRVQLNSELDVFLKWFETSKHNESLPPLLRVALTHFWFITLHPFDDGNGRLARALTDLAMGQAYASSTRLLSLSLSILNNRKGYYEVLESCQKSGLDISEWIVWFLNSVIESVQFSQKQIESNVFKTRFWKKHLSLGLNAGQVKVLNRLLDGDFELGISASQYQTVAKVSKATATRHLAELVKLGCLDKLAGGGRSTRYSVKKKAE